MKILKPGKVEQRKFACPRCRCLFVASYYETKLENGRWVRCPHCGKTNKWNDGEPYEEPTPTQGGIDRITSIIADLGYVTETTAWDIAVQLTEHGVTFREG